MTRLPQHVLLTTTLTLTLGLAGSASAALLADGFATGTGDYSLGLLAGQTGTPESGSYEAAWSGGTGTSFGDPGVVTTGLSYTDASNYALNVSGGSVTLERTSNSTTIDKLGSVNPAGNPGTNAGGVVYFSGLLSLGDSNFATLGLKIGTKQRVGVGVNSSGNAEIRQGGAGSTAGSVVATSIGTFDVSGTVFIVGRIQDNGLGSGKDRVSVYINPLLTSEGLNTEAAVADFGTNAWFPNSGENLDELFFLANLVGQQTGTGFDEFRVGSTWADVTPNTLIPEPASLALMGLGGLLMLGRSRRA